MCIGSNSLGGPKRCPEGAASRCERCADAVARNTSTVNAIATEQQCEHAHVLFLEEQRRAIMGELSAQEEHALLLRAANRSRHPEDAPPIRTSDDAALLEQLDPDRDYSAEYAEHIESNPDTDIGSYHDYLKTELAEQHSLADWQADEASGAYLRMERDLQVQLARETATGMSVEQLQEHIAGRVGSAEFQALLDARDAARDRRRSCEQQWELAKNSDDVDIVAAARDDLHDAHCDYLVATDDLEAFKDETAQYSGRLGQLLAVDRTFDSDHLGECVKVGEFDPGSRKWLEQRQTGIGGSEIGVILGVKDPKNLKNSTDVKASKLQPITDEQVAEQAAARTAFTGPPARGHAVGARDRAAIRRRKPRPDSPRNQRDMATP
jgi:hypothetical protein